MSKLPLIELFWQLRDAGLPLTIERYNLASEALNQRLSQGLDITDYRQIARLYKALWTQNRKEQKIFDREFEKFISQTINTVTQNLPESQTSPSQETSSTSTRPSSGQFPADSSQTAAQVTPLEANIPEFVEFMESFDVGKAMRLPTPAKPIKSPTKDYFPISRSQMQEAWRQLHPSQASAQTRQLDNEATVNDIARRGFFVAPVYLEEKTRQHQIILLVDRSDSMIPFNPLWQQIRETWTGVTTYYFRNTPQQRLYHDPQCWQSETLDDLLAPWMRESVLVIIFSDAGAARRNYISERIDQTDEFLAQLTAKVERVAWLNPYPKEVWSQTTAAEIAAIHDIDSDFAMFALEPRDFEQMPSWLLGQTPLKTTEIPVASEVNDDTELSEDLSQAQATIQIFRDIWGEPQYQMAQHAAFPLALTPDVLYRLWHKFLRRKQDSENGTVPWYAVADVLLSRLCQKVDQELYEMTRDIRNELLKTLELDYGRNRLQELSQFVLSYVEQQLNSSHPQEKEIAQTQQWAALAYVEPGQATQKLAAQLKQAYEENNKAEIVRLASLTETLAESLADYQPLLVIARGYGSYARGDSGGVTQARREISQEFGQENCIQIEGVSLEKPGNHLSRLPLQPFSFETVTVNRRGEIINRQSQTARYFREDLGNGVSLDMVYIPGGSFMMGAPAGEMGSDDDERPQHQVTLQPFFMGKYAITQAQWRVVAGLPKLQRDLDPDPSDFKGDNRPVETVNWYDAVEFCARLSIATGRQYVLPSEAQWEYACRANTKTPFHFGETITADLANYRGTYAYANEPTGKRQGKTTSVGSFPPNGFGLYDMHGNIWEGCADPWHDNYEEAPTDGRVWDESRNDNCYESYAECLTDLLSNTSMRVLRGGSWGYVPDLCRSANRDLINPVIRSFNLGFRVAYNLLLKLFQFETVTVNRQGEIIERQTQTARYYQEDLGNGVSLDMVYIPGGSFYMGAPEEEKESINSERPQHRVTLQSFFMGKYPITQAQWRAVAALPKLQRDLDPDPSEFKGDNRSVENVNWYDAVEFCARLSVATGRQYVLPSEAQWEYACRANTKTPFHFGETITAEIANYNGSRTYADEPKGEYREETIPVGSFPPNSFGLYDMHGNVWEWCADPSHSNYEKAPIDGQVWDESRNNNRYQNYADYLSVMLNNKSKRILRGGSWDYYPWNCRSADRSSLNPDDTYFNDGVRVVCVSPRTRNQ